MCLPGLRYDCDLRCAVLLRRSYECTTSVDAARRRPEASPATQHEHSQQRTTNIPLVIGRTPAIVKRSAFGGPSLDQNPGTKLKESRQPLGAASSARAAAT